MVDASRRELNLPEGEYVEFTTTSSLQSRLHELRALNRDVTFARRLPKVTNVSERNVFLSAHTAVGAISAQGERPLDRPMVRTSSLKYQAWKAEAWEGSYPDDYRARLDEAAAELADDSSWKEPRPPSPRHLLTADGELRETCKVDDESSEGGRQPFADQAPGVPLSLTEAAKSKTPAVFCYHACHFEIRCLRRRSS
ncbi:hypothetical protein Ae201684P_021056 [Aphanomyces euteiches]|nr:hypothetical protein Ae201684P_021056 [Aphanomyces euteiches]